MGRPRAAGPRYPSGQLKSKHVPESRVAPAAIHRIREHAIRLGADPRFGTELGRQLLLEQVSALEAGAGFRMAGVYGMFEYFHGKRRSTKSPDYGVAAERIASLRSPEERDEAEHDAAIAFMRLQTFLGNWPMNFQGWIEQLCVDDTPISAFMLSEVRPILARMGRVHFGTTRSAPAREKPVAARPRPLPGPTDDAFKAAPSQSPVLHRSPDRACLERLVKALRPDLESEGVSVAWDMFAALRDREKFRDDKKSSPANSL